MRSSPGTGLDFLLEQLRWSIRQPLVHGDRAWADRVGRILDRLATVLDGHVHAFQRPGGTLEQIGGDGLLPFTEEAREVAGVRRRQQRVRTRLHSAAAEFRAALGLFPPLAESPADSGTIEPLQETRAYLLFKALGLCVADILVELEACLADERSLLQTESVTNSQRE
jgi:hypothetical protein